MKSASTRLLVAALDLLTATLILAASLVRLLATGATWATRRLSAPTAAVGARPNLRVVQDDGKRQQLARGLVGMGFRAADVRADTGAVNDAEMARMSMPDLFKSCIGKLGRAA